LTNVTTKLPFLQFQGWLQYQLDHLHIVDDTGLMGAGSALLGNLMNDKSEVNREKAEWTHLKLRSFLPRASNCQHRMCVEVAWDLHGA